MKLNHLSKSIHAWQTVLIVLVAAPVFILNAQLFQPPHHYSNFILRIEFPQYAMLQQSTYYTNYNAKSLETLNSRKLLSSHDDSNRNVMLLHAEKPVYKMHRIEQLQQEPANYIDLVAKIKNEYFNEDGNKMWSHGQQGNAPKRQNNALMLDRNPAVTKMMAATENRQNVAMLLSVGTEHSQSDESERNIKNIIPDYPHVIIMNGPTRIYGSGTESKFPPVLEFFVQRIQKYFSIYKFEDLSRPGVPSTIAVYSGNSLKS